MRMPTRLFSGLSALLALVLSGGAYVRADNALPPVRTRQAVPPSQAPRATLTDAQRAVLAKYCVTCHNEKLVATGAAPVRLDGINLDRVGDHAAILEKVLHKLRYKEMPPPGMPRPDPATYDAIVAYLESELDRAAAERPNPGRPTIRRLNRNEYANAIRDLLAFEIDAAAMLPAETLAYGFDNIGDVLNVSPGLFERYLSAAQRISRFAVGDPKVAPAVERYIPSKYLIQDYERMSEEAPFGSRGGFVFKHLFPVDGEYGIRVDVARITAHDQQVDVRVDGERVTLIHARQNNRGQPGIGTPEAGPPQEIRFEAKAGMRSVAVTFLKTSLAAEGVGPRRPPGFGKGGAQVFRDPLGEVLSVDLGGPYRVDGVGDTPSRQRIFICRPAAASEEEACATRIMSALVRRAYRRPVVAARDVQPLMAMYKDARQEGQSFEAGIQRAIARLLVDPAFLFRLEQDPPPQSPVYRLSDVELATRLSFFLWSTIPDEELLSEAERGRLSDPAVLERQVRRMLADERADTLISNFAAQWLYLRNLQQLQPDFNRFPEWDDNLRDAFRRETELFLASQMRDDRPVGEMLTANYTFANERLARHYGLPRVYGSHFRRVPLTDSNRAGILGHGSLLTITSYAHRTSPVLRGKWLLENILDSPLPPPPANVPPLDDQDKATAGQVLTLRAKMERHRKDPGCAVCHVRMDPLGFALENFDAIGRWRSVDGGATIDPSGALPDGTKLDGPAGLRQLLMTRKQQFATTFTSRLMTYALGRGVEYYDMPAVRQIVRDSAATDHRWSSIILGIVRSVPFQMRIRES